MLVEGTPIVLGCTIRSIASVQTSSRRTRPIGSARMVRTGPTGTTPRRTVGNRELLFELGALPQARDGEFGEPRTDRHLELGAQDTRAGRVGDRDDPDGRLAHHHAAVRQRESHPVRGAADQVDRRDDHQHHAGPGDRHELRPAEPVSDDERHRDESGHDPAERGDDRAQPGRRPSDRATEDPAVAHQEHHDIRQHARARTDQLGAHVGEARCAGRSDRVGAGRRGRRAADAADRHTACRSLGGGVSRSSWEMMLDEVTPSNSASGSRIRRCASTGSASDLMSSGTT